jgi:hypothetical protein
MRHKLNVLIDSIEQALNAWYYSRHGFERERTHVSSAEMKDFLRDVSDWGHMFFCLEDMQAMDQRDKHIKERSPDYEQSEITH